MTHEPAIGVEVHVQLATETKLFCRDAVEFGAEPNTHVCPVCLGLPGALPALNEHAVELATRAALGLGCAVHETSAFARKHYFYPDLPKGYQITQYARPLATGGRLEVMAGDGHGRGRGHGHGRSGVRIRRLHLEEDAGKSLHDRFAGETAVDLNRAGVPLVEVVTEPDIASPAHARAFLDRLKRTLEYLGVSDCEMQTGSLRVDANVSVRPVGSERLGTKTELKNLNSFRNLERALEFEIERQTRVLEAGSDVARETLLWDERAGEARPLRSKRERGDYRYLREPDLPPLVLEPSEVARVREGLPELPDARRRRFRERYGLSADDAGVLTATRELADYFEATAREANDPEQAGNWVRGEVLGWLNRERCELDDLPVTPAELAELIGLIEGGTISNNTAKDVFATMIEDERGPAVIVEEEALAQVSGAARLEAWAREAIAEHPEEAERYRGGEERLMGFFMGRVMRASRGRADPGRAREVLGRVLAG